MDNTKTNFEDINKLARTKFKLSNSWFCIEINWSENDHRLDYTMMNDKNNKKIHDSIQLSHRK